MRLIEEHNLQAKKGLSTFTMGLNKFADLVKFYKIYQKFGFVLSSAESVFFFFALKYRVNCSPRLMPMLDK